MPKVKLLQGRAGVGFSQAPGEEIEVSAKEAEAMIAAEQAIPVGKPESRTRTRKPRGEEKR